MRPDDVTPALAIGPTPPPFPDVARIAVLRGGGLGDLLFAVPAIESLAAAYPDAEIVLLGTGFHRDLLADRPGPVSAVLPLPRVHGVHDPDGLGTDEAAVERFTDRAGHFDLGVQAHGGGRWSNPFLLRLRPTWTVGCRTPDAAELTRCLPFSYYQHEIMRALEVAGLAGAPPAALVPRVAVTDADLAAAARAVGEPARPRLVVHPGATDPRRRWPAERFGEVAAALAGDAEVVVIGTADEADLAAAVVAAAHDRLPPAARASVRSVAGALDAKALIGVLATARAVVANDSGPRHLAEAVGAPTVSVYWMGNVINAGPPGRLRHRLHISWTARCPECGADCTRQDLARCPHQVSFVADVPVEGVLADTADLVGRGEAADEPAA
ncbi:glycosyltransferase family 9 protein [Actinokineospora sp. UTMC 2448]|uniref:glycosyltransferase family 9 protein n=1 Tax=Actinokineospora sp. UTMC 2448 TaxID=2268449 RepID=UPI002164EBE7|nr:glycosyltransferase family 9 protein [Actinokineospora sp. UTMC 2448]UVS80340.1 ADP-heptose--LPS heptosyltransferase 2 [Actinokineospora sp. UTMC 2448]